MEVVLFCYCFMVWVVRSYDVCRTGMDKEINWHLPMNLRVGIYIVVSLLYVFVSPVLLPFEFFEQWRSHR